jgi:hypothetical protein
VIPAAKIKESQLPPEAFTNQWYVLFDYLELALPPFDKQHAEVILLDGNFAIRSASKDGTTKVFDPADKPEHGQKREDQKTDSAATDSPRPGTAGLTFDPPIRSTSNPILNSPTFTPARLQWNTSEEFPMNLREAVSNATQYVSSGDAATRKILIDVGIEHFDPGEAALAKIGATRETNRWHWLVKLTFAPPHKEFGSSEMVYMLLDGTILGALPVPVARQNP